MQDKVTLEQLKNCPNCGGTLEDDGRCMFCGSKVYDLFDIDLDCYKHKYIRIKYNGSIQVLPVIFGGFNLTYGPDVPTVDYNNQSRYVSYVPDITGSVEFRVLNYKL